MTKKKNGLTTLTEVVQTFGEIVDMEFNDFKDLVHKCAYGDLCGLKNLLALTYERLKKNVDGLRELYIKTEDEQKKEQAQKTISETFIKMQMIEDKYIYLNHYLDEKAELIKN